MCFPLLLYIALPIGFVKMSYDRSAIVDTHQQTKDSITHIISSTKLISLTLRANTHDVAQMDDRGDTDTNGH